VLQDRIEPGLRAWHAPLGADWQMRQVFQGRYADAAEFVPLHVCDEHAVERPIARKPPAANLVDDTELAAELHGPNTDFQHLRRVELVFSLLDQQGRNASPPKVGRERKPDRPAAGDQGEGFEDVVPVGHEALAIALTVLAHRSRSTSLRFAQ